MHRLALLLPAAAVMTAFFTVQAQQLSTSPISAPGCTGAVTSTGFPAICEVYGNPDPSANDAQLVAAGLPPHQFTMFIVGLSSVPPMTVNSGNGWICINPGGAFGLGRFQAPHQLKSSGPLGRVTLDTTAGEWDLSAIPRPAAPYAIVSGMTTYFHAWFREPVGAGYNFTGSTIMTWQ